MNKLSAVARRKVEERILAVLDPVIPNWVTQHKVLGEIMAIVSPGDNPSERAEMEQAVAEIMVWDPVLNRTSVERLARILMDQHYPPSLLREAYKLSPDSPWGRDWRSDKGTKPPSEKGLRDTVAFMTRQSGSGGVVDLG